MRQSIAIDMDGVIADVEAQLIAWYYKETGQLMNRQIFSGVPEPDAFPDKTAVYRFVTSPGFFRSMPLMPGAVEAVQALMNTYDVFIVSAAMEFPLSLYEKYEWLSEHLPFVSWKQVVFCGSKSIIRTDYMIDDHSKNLDYFHGKAIMFTAGHNMHQQKHRRVNNWAEALEFFEKDLRKA
ncbi:MAG: 5'(3')-deoxyribonucleotidase [Chitinophagaceae bacterium]|nr:5'(3')-deoxyribonucleotidase [Chitinophagaceae bacterium]